MSPMNQNSFTRDDLLRCGKGLLFGQGNAQLPLPNMLMIDRITSIKEHNEGRGKGELCAELDIDPDLWFFKCHFDKDPVMPGCLGLDALWQLLGFYLAWLGHPGRGRALGCGSVKFAGEVLPHAGVLTYHLRIRRVIKRSVTLGVGEGEVYVDGREIYTTKDLRVGLFLQPDDLKGLSTL